MHTSLHSYSTLISYSKYKPGIYIAVYVLFCFEILDLKIFTDILNSSQNTNSKSISSDEFNNSSSESDCNSEIGILEIIGGIQVDLCYICLQNPLK